MRRFPMLLLLSACGGPVMQARLGGETVHFDDRTTMELRDVEGVPELFVCGVDDPAPTAQDDQQVLCLTLQFHPGALERLKAGDEVVLRGAPQFPEGTGRVPAAFTAKEGHSATVRTVWVDLSAFCLPWRTDARTQAVEGRLAVQSVTAQRLAGHVQVRAEGALGGVPCVSPTGAAELDFRFDLPRP